MKSQARFILGPKEGFGTHNLAPKVSVLDYVPLNGVHKRADHVRQGLQCLLSLLTRLIVQAQLMAHLLQQVQKVINGGYLYTMEQEVIQ